MNLSYLTPDNIEKMSYIDFISVIKEENRPPGGKKTIREFLRNSFMNKGSKILEVGCTNGFTSLEVARLLDCKVWGIDVHKKSVENAKSRIKEEKVKFLVGDAENLPFKSNFFDMVISSNATSFMNNKNKAIQEYFRVIKPWGFLATCPMYYTKKPSKGLLKKVSKILGFDIEIKTKEHWVSTFKESGFEIYFVKDYLFEFQSEKKINNLVKEILNKPSLLKLSDELKYRIKTRWKKTLSIFNKNLFHMGYSVILLRKRDEKEETELFTSKEI
jgi:ubiquinone/menaquinone biosynthesis C-methylase UbiE